MSFTEQEAAEVFGVEVEDHGTEEGLEGGAELPEGQGTSDDQSGQEGGSEGVEGGSEVVDDQEGQEGAQSVQSPEERHRQAAARRAREDAARAAAEQARRDKIFEDMFAGQTNPYTNQPIRTEAEFRAYEAQKARAEQDQQLRQAGIDPQTIQGIVDQRMAPIQEQIQRAQMAEARARAQAVNAQAKEAIAGHLKSIAALDPSIHSLEDIAAMPTAGRFNELVQKGVNMEDAFYLANRREIEARKVAAATAAAQTRASSRSHLAPVRSAAGELPVEVSADQMEMYREMMPNASDEEIRKAYTKFTKDLGR